MRQTEIQRNTDQSSTHPIDRELITIKEFARLLSISIWTARKLAYAGKIASVKLGSRLQIPASEVARVVGDNLRARQ
jgi:excisionase family DNA binding protein